MISDIYDFLADVAANNNRPWFYANRGRYDDLRARWYDDLEHLIACMSQWEPGMKTQTASTASYRFSRDTRFSPDKSPYKVYFSAALSPFGRKTIMSGYYLQVDVRPGENGLYAGLYCPEQPLLKKLRHAIVDNIEEFEEIVNEPRFAARYPGWVGQRLKSAPQGWPKDHPQIELLKLKDYGRFAPCDHSYFTDPRWYERAAEDFLLARPLIDFLNYSIAEE